MKEVQRALKMLLIMLVLLGILYPAVVTFVAQVLFYESANGSLLVKGGKVIGSRHIGQNFVSEHYFWGRPSQTDYNTLPSSGSNLGPTSSELKKLVNERREFLAETHGVQNLRAIPDDLIFASGSGLDPHISPAAAFFQVERVANARGLKSDEDKKKIRQMIERHIEKHPIGFLKADRVNVLLLNKALDEL